MQQQIAHPTADHVAFQAQFVSRLTHQMQDRIFYFRIGYNHRQNFCGCKSTKKFSHMQEKR